MRLLASVWNAHAFFCSLLYHHSFHSNKTAEMTTKNYVFAKSCPSRAFATYLTCLACLHAFVPCTPSHLGCFLAFHSFVPYLPYSRQLYLFMLKLFQDVFVVQQKLSIFQGLSKPLQTVLILSGSKKNAVKPFKRENFLSIFKM